MSKDNPSVHELRAWQIENPMAPHQWLELAQRLSDARQLGNAWSQLRRQNVPVMQFFSLVTTAYESAVSEAARAPEASEKAKLSRVVRLATELKAAIEDSPMPRQAGHFAALPGAGPHDPPLQILMGMRDDQPANLQRMGWNMGHHPLAVTWVLDRAIELVRMHESSLPPRAVTRRRARPEVASFVRVLVYLLSREFGKELHGTVASVASAIFDLDADAPLDKAAVQGILRDSPPAFSRPKDVRASS